MEKKKRVDKSNPENLKIEKEKWDEGYSHIAGVDEVGRGCFAGPVVAAAVIMPKEVRIDRLTDSKKIPKKEHKDFVEKIKKEALAWAVGVASVSEIDEINIKNASRLAMKRAIENLEVKPDYLLVDGTEIVEIRSQSVNQQSVVKGDYYSHSISAAAIIAKDYRDELLAKYDEEYDNVYAWAKNAGYQTKVHLQACEEHGVTKYHRKTWSTMDKFKKINLKDY